MHLPDSQTAVCIAFERFTIAPAVAALDGLTGTYVRVDFMKLQYKGVVYPIRTLFGSEFPRKYFVKSDLVKSKFVKSYLVKSRF